MKRLLMLLNFALVFSSLALAENFSGKYVLESGEGDTVLNVQQNARGEVQGTLELDDGTLYQLGGEIENNEAIGIASNQGRTNLFKLRFQGGELIYTLIAIGPDGNPDLANAQEFPFTRQGGGEALGAAGPMTADPAASGGAASDPFVGTFADERAKLQLSGSGGKYTGQMQFQGQTFPVRATSPDGRSLNGTFTSGGNSFRFNAILQGVIIIATFGFPLSFFISISSSFSTFFLSSLILRISFLLKPILYPESNLIKIIPLSVSGFCKKVPL